MPHNALNPEYLEYLCFDESGNEYRIYDDGIDIFWDMDEENHFLMIQRLGFGWYLLYNPSNIEGLILLSPIKQK